MLLFLLLFATQYCSRLGCDTAPMTRSDLRNEAAFTRGPIEKFLHNRRIPYKLIANVLMVVLLACLTEVYVVPIRSALGNERHAMTETLLSLGRGEDVTASYESKWHGDYVEMPRIMVASLDALQRHVQWRSQHVAPTKWNSS
ncbi:MAG: hypothetical protein COA68_12330 [Oceanobacter sp.]|nr:MAG: hypothetical protein COA68_12330 [Oceanobacter sp.]